jgi:hypothetical protein
MCHVASGWEKAVISDSFDHSKYGFELSGAHARTDCMFCHNSLEFEKVSTECSGCHQDVHQGEFGTDCSLCHGTRTFVDRAEQISAHRETRFPLSGAHATLDCQQCHRASLGGAQFVNTPTECYACHESDYASTQSPNHMQAGFSTDCSECHNMATFTGGTYGSHDFFPLKGGHAGLECTQCHTSGQLGSIDRECVACHRSDYDATTDPVHVDAGFSTECESCHDINSWTDANFDHDSTAFPLTGAHRTAACAQCHVDGHYAGTQTACDACHHQDYVSAVDPNHVTANFPLECETCHSTSSWDGASFDHDATAFPLTGAHRAVPCTECHVGGQFTGTDSECNACHAQDFDATTDPQHQSAGFPRTCDVCHGTIAWAPAQFDHSTTAFPLTGAHVTVACADCHVGGQYAGTQSDCYACHRSDYDTTNDPAHAAAGFGQDCATCHNTSGWSGASFDHDQWFPIGAGSKHAGRWDTCQDCHTNPANYMEYTCLSCHPHDDRANTDGHHREVGGYRYDSVACYDCHPRGRGD